MTCTTVDNMGHFPHTSHYSAWRLLILAVAMMVSCHAAAQNNPYKIKDELYRMYMVANRDRYKAVGLEESEQMLRRAVQLGDHKAECIALIPPITYWQYKKDITQFEKAVKRLQERALATGHVQYFYYAVSQKMNWLLLQQRRMEALTYTQEMVEFARRHKHAYGIYTGFNNMGNLHYSRGEYGLAANFYKRALEFGTDNLPDQEMAPMYRKIAECYEEIYRFDDALDYSLQGYALAKSQMSRRRLLRSICIYAFMLGKYDVFRQYYDEFGKNGGTLDPRTKDLSEIEVLAIKATDEGRTYEADSLINIIPDKIQIRHKQLMWIEVARKLGDYKLMANNQQKFYRGRIEGQDRSHRSSFAEIDGMMVNLGFDFENQVLATERQRLLNERQRTDIDNANLELANTQLSLRNSSLELSRTRANGEMTRLSYNRKQLEADKLRGEIKRSKAQQAFGNTILASASAFGIIALIALALYLHSRNKLMARLQATHDVLERSHTLLAEALNRAETANRAKSRFINNLGEDIRGPLNSVAQLARTIAETRKGATAEEVTSLNRRIHADTDAMLAIVDGVLKKTQSGD